VGREEQGHLVRVRTRAGGECPSREPDDQPL